MHQGLELMQVQNRSPIIVPQDQKESLDHPESQERMAKTDNPENQARVPQLEEQEVHRRTPTRLEPKGPRLRATTVDHAQQDHQDSQDIKENEDKEARKEPKEHLDHQEGTENKERKVLKERLDIQEILDQLEIKELLERMESDMLKDHPDPREKPECPEWWVMKDNPENAVMMLPQDLLESKGLLELLASVASLVFPVFLAREANLVPTLSIALALSEAKAVLLNQKVLDLLLTPMRVLQLQRELPSQLNQLEVIMRPVEPLLRRHHLSNK